MKPAQTWSLFVKHTSESHSMAITAAKPTSETFTGLNGSATAPWTINGFVYEVNGAAANMVLNTWSAGTYGNDGTSSSMNSLQFWGQSTQPVYAFHSISLQDNFHLLSLRFGAATYDIVIEGYDDGVLKASDTVVKMTADSTGSVTYTMDQYSSGTLTFDETWSNIDTVKFKAVPGTASANAGTSFGFVIDDITLREPIIQLAAESDSNVARDRITNDGTPLLKGVAPADATVDIFVNNSSVATSTVVADNSGNFKVDDLELQDGSYAIAAKVRGATDAFSTVTITIDTQVAAPDNLALATGTLPTDYTPTIKGKAEAKASVTLFDGTVEVGTATANSNGDWTIDTSKLDDGVHSLTAVQKDVAGNVSGASTALEVTVAAGRPGAPALDDASDTGTKGDNITKLASPTLTGTAGAGATVFLRENGITIGQGTANADGVWSIAPTAALSHGEHTLSAAITDPNPVVDPYNPFPWSSPISSTPALMDGPQLTVTIDTQPPVVPAALALAAASDTGTSGDGKTTSRTPTITGTAEAHASVTLYEGSRILGSSEANANGEWSIASATLAVGEHALTAMQSDAAGNVSPASSTFDMIVLTGYTIKLDASSDTGASGTDNITKDGTPLMTGIGEANAHIDIYVDGGSTPFATVDSDADGKFSVTNLDLDDGTYVISARAHGAGGDGASVTITIDTHANAPSLALQSGTQLFDYTPTIKGTAEANAEVTLYEGTTILGTDTADANGNWSVTTTVLSDGAHVLKAVQEDVAGNASEASAALTVTVQTGRPGTPVLAAATDSGVKGDNVTNVKMPTLIGTAAANTTVFLREGSTIVGQGQAGSDGKWSITTSVELQHGDHVLTAAILDPNASASVNVPPGAQVIALPQYLTGPALTVTIDTQAPAAPAGLALAATSDSGTKGDGITTIATPAVTGTASANATVTLYDGERALGTAQANSDGAWSIASPQLALGVHALTAVQSDIAGNISLGSTPFNLTIEAEPVAEAPVTTIDGVDVGVTPVTLPGGGSGTAVTVPVVTPGRVEQNGGTSTADIPLSTQSGAALVTAQVHTGSGLAASGGTSQGAQSSLAHLIAAIKATGSTTGSTDTGGMTGSGSTFLSLLPASSALLVQTVTLSGEGKADLVAGQNTGTPVAIVLDGTQVPAGGAVTLKDIPFAAVFGSLTVTGSTAGQILTGDAAGQTFIVSHDAGGRVLAGGGTDVLQFGFGTSGNAAASGGDVPAAVTLLHGGSATDTAVFKGAAADYTVEQHDGFLLVASNNAPEQVAKLVNVEALQFDDSKVTVENRAALTTLAGLYENALGRQADVDGFAYWAGVEAQGVSMGTIALQLITSAEGVASFGALNGDASHDMGILYQGIFNRAADTAGLAYWAEQLAHGATLENVAQAMTQSAEIVGHQMAVTDWNFAG